MINEKEQTLEIFNTISNEGDFDNEYIKELVKETEEDLKNGRVMSIEEAVEKMQKKYDEFYIQYMKEAIRESEEQFKNGNFITLEEFEKKMEAKYENSDVRYGKTEHK